MVSSLALGQKEVIDYVIEHLDLAGYNVLSCHGKEIDLLPRFFINKLGHPRVGLMVPFH